MPDALYYLEHSSQQPYWVGAIICLSLPAKKLKPRKVKQFSQMAGNCRETKEYGHWSQAASVSPGGELGWVVY